MSVLFANGAEWDDWQRNNCRLCKKGADDYQNSETFPACHLYDELWHHAATHDELRGIFPDRLGIVDGKMPNKCGEFEGK